MSDTIKTERLVLRRFSLSDTEPVTDALQDIEVVRMIPRMPWPYTRSHAELFLTETAPSEPNSYAVTHAGDVIGAVRGGSHLGYWLTREAWGRGFATEAASAVLALHFAQTKTAVHSGYRLENERSRRVLRKLGFRPSGFHSSYCNVDHAEITVQTVELKYSDWQARQ